MAVAWGGGAQLGCLPGSDGGVVATQVETALCATGAWGAVVVTCSSPLGLVLVSFCLTRFFGFLYSCRLVCYEH